MAVGVGAGERVALWAVNVPEWVVLQFALAKIGAVLVTVNTSFRPVDLESPRSGFGDLARSVVRVRDESVIGEALGDCATPLQPASERRILGDEALEQAEAAQPREHPSIRRRKRRARCTSPRRRAARPARP